MEPPYRLNSEKANNNCAFLQRNLNKVPASTKEQGYQTQLRPITEYASHACAPFTQSNNDKLEMLQRGAARFDCSDFRRTSSVTSLRWWQSLAGNPLTNAVPVARVIFLNRIVNDLVAMPSAEFLTPSPHKFVSIAPRIDVCKHTFIPSAVRLGNTYWTCPGSISGRLRGSSTATTIIPQTKD